MTNTNPHFHGLLLLILVELVILFSCIKESIDARPTRHIDDDRIVIALARP